MLPILPQSQTSNLINWQREILLRHFINSILSANPCVLERNDQISLVDNLLHIAAAAAGNIHFAMEIATLRHSLAWKPDHLGFSPNIHLALQNGHSMSFLNN